MAGKIAQLSSPREALDSLCEWFYEDRLSAEGCEPVSPSDMPQASRDLLIHHEHMTLQLQAYHRRPIELRVLHHRTDGNLYVRNVELVLAGTDHVVEFGIVRLDLDFVAKDVREAILARKRPLGDILIEHDVLRRIEPRWYFRFEQDSPIAAHFGPDHDGDVYGRLGTIYCEEQPAIELLEVVTEARASA
jgi:hypothetical protein